MRGAAKGSGLVLAVWLGLTLTQTSRAQTSRSVRIAVTVAVEPAVRVDVARLIVVAVPTDGRDGPEPRHRIGQVGRGAIPIAAVDVSADQLTRGAVLVVDESSTSFPADGLAGLPAGGYTLQAVLDQSRDLQLVAAPGNLYSPPVTTSIEPRGDLRVELALTEREPADTMPPDTQYVRHVRLRSERLSTFHGRPIFLRAAVVVPRGFDDPASKDRRYPLRVSVGGYGERFTAGDRAMQTDRPFRSVWLADDTPRMLRVFLDGAGPYGDPYQVNSANNGPYGDAVTRELIPAIEQRFRGTGSPHARVVDGVSTGGWVALALQMFYPDVFNGAWSFCPDSVDFRAFQRVNIYDDDNAYVDGAGLERPSRRGPNGGVRFTMAHELQMENVLGRGDSWTRSGRQWGAWNAVYGPRGGDGQPTPLWDPVSGVIDRAAVAHWEQYDLRLVLARSWTTLAPKLDGKLNIWIGEMDDYFLNDAVHLLDDALGLTDPSFDVRIRYGPGQPHCWVPLSDEDVMREMGRRTGATP